MNRKEIKKVMQELAMSQGFYGRLLRKINEMDAEAQEEVWTEMEAQNWGDAVEMVMAIEG